MKRLFMLALVLVLPLALWAQTAPQVVIGWDAPTSGNVDSYNVYRSQVAGVYGPKLNAAPVTLRTYTDNSVVRGQSYFYRVTAVNSAGESGPSNEITVTIPNVIPSAPTNLRVISSQ